jgi:hypothetical protein
MELAAMAAMDHNIFKMPKLEALATIISEVEACRGSVRLKFQWAMQIVTGSPFDKGAQPFQDFDLLIALRDMVVHLKPEHISDEPPALARRLQKRGLIDPVPPDSWESLVGKLCDVRIADWACTVPNRMAEPFAKALDDTALIKMMIRDSYVDRTAAE